jgi:hypothetical protein
MVSDSLLCVWLIGLGLMLMLLVIGFRRPHAQQQLPSVEKPKRDTSDIPYVPYDLYREGEIYRRIPFNSDLPRNYTVGDDGEITETD